MANQASTAVVRSENILAWLEDPATDTGLRFADGDGWQLHPYAELSMRARRAATLLQAAGVRPGSTVLVVCPTSPDFVAMFFGTLLSGATPATVGIPASFQSRTAYLAHIDRLRRLVGPAAIATTPELRSSLGDVTEILGTPVVTDSGESDVDLSAPLPLSDIGILQFSSGSTAEPKGVRVSLEAINANVTSIRDWLDWGPDDRLVSWLPLHHDMGLVGGLLAAMSRSSDIWLLRPDQFIRSPHRWLSAFSEMSATTSASPTFGLAHVLRRVRPADLDGLDLSTWRTLIVGAERVEPAVLRSFADLLAPYGFRREVLLPAYGLAEVTLAASATRPRTGWRSVTVDPASLALGQPVGVRTTGQGTEITSCGTALPAMGLRILDEAGEPLPDGTFGEIEVSGPSLAQGYVGADDAGHFARGALPTGDAGFLLHGELYVVGRLGDSLKQLGKWVFAEEIERVAVDVSPRPNRTVAMLGTLDGRDTAVVVVEGIDPIGAALVGKALTKHALGLRVEVRRGRTGWIQRTTSGKPMRRKMWERLVDDPALTELLWHGDERE
ncbi:AMP-binding protein [Micromonospora sp. C95]|nr:AMP-binding protein [Micromonospora sp. C95]